MNPSRTVIALTALLTGCMSVGPDYTPPNPAIPPHWSQEDGQTSTAQLHQWWKLFNDPELDNLIACALAANPNLQQALVKIEDLRAQRRFIFADALPEFSGKSSVSRRFNNSTSSAQSGASQGGGFGIGNNVINIFQTGFDAQWELDFFGGVQRALESADATIASEQENSHAIQVTLLAEVARYYLQLRKNQQLLAIAQNQLNSHTETEKLIQTKQQAGFITESEVSQAQVQTAQIQTQLPVHQLQLQQAIHALSALLGRPPDDLANRLAGIKPIPKPNAALWPDLPSELLQRRPDIRRAERQLAAATASIGVAVSQLYPKINLSAFLGLQNAKITDVTPLGKSWSTGASLTLPIFNWGKLTANIDSKKAQAKQLGWAYQATVLAALQEVEDALIAYKEEQQRHQALMQAVTANQLALELANNRYQNGLDEFIEVLARQQNLQQAQTNAIISESALSENLVRLYKALGGGWQNTKN